MRKLRHFLIIIFVLIQQSLFAQISFDQSYNGYINRVDLENSGEKYYYTDIANKQIRIYTANHTLWKTISLPTTTDATLSTTIHLSENTINSDNMIEIIYSFYTNKSGVISWESRIINENGATLFSLPNASAIFVNKIDGLENKLFAYFSDGSTFKSKVYNISNFSEEQSYSGYINRVKLENSGEKYYYTDFLSKQIKIYNSNHSIWKTIVLPTKSTTSLSKSIHLSENKINSDNLLEIIYTTSTNTEGTTSFESHIINENNVSLLSIPNASALILSAIEGLQNKLIAYFPNGSTYNSKVYSLLTFTTERNYDGYLNRIKLDNAGEKYFVTNFTSKQVEIYNGNHSIWKIVNLQIPTNSTLSTAIHLSDNQINSDNLVEIMYSFSTTYNDVTYWESQIINENENILLSLPNASFVSLNNISGLQKNIFAYSSVGTKHTNEVYSLPTDNTVLSDLQDLGVIIFPNPAENIVTIETNNKNISSIKIISSNGEIFYETELNSYKTTIELTKLAPGIYFIIGLGNEQIIFTEKLVKI